MPLVSFQLKSSLKFINSKALLYKQVLNFKKFIDLYSVSVMGLTFVNANITPLFGSHAEPSYLTCKQVSNRSSYI